MQDIRFGLRIMLRHKSFTLIAVVTLALGIGANTAIFSVVNALVFNPLPYPEPSRLLWITNTFRGDEMIGADALQHFQAQSQTIESLAGYAAGTTTLSEEDGAAQVNVVRATAGVFAALGVQPWLGRAFTPGEDRPGAPHVVVLNYEFWQRRFGGSPSALGQELRYGAERYTVIGVMPRGFRFLPEHRTGGLVDVITPYALNDQRNSPQITIIEGGVFGRLRQGVTREQAQAELSLIAQREANTHAPPGIEVKVTPLAERLVGHLRRGLLVLFGAVLCVLLIACGNVANLLLARGNAREKEMAVRAALGAGRKRLLRQMLTESLLLSLSGGLAGFLLAWWGVKLLVALTPDDMLQLKASRVDSAVLWFSCGATLLTGVLAGLIPAWQAARVEVNAGLKDGARGSSLLRHKSARRVSPALVISELALTLVLLIGAGLLVKSFRQLRAVELGYNPKNLLTFNTPFRHPKYPFNSPERKLIQQELRRRLSALPGVEAVGVSVYLPLHDKRIANKPRLTIAGRPLLPDNEKPLAGAQYVSPDFFRALGVPLRAGREFTAQDDEHAPPVIVINETLARRHFAGENPLGQRIRAEHTKVEATVIGVAADMKWTGPAEEPQAEIFFAHLQNSSGGVGFALRTAGDPLALLPALHQTITTLEPEARLLSARTMEQRLSDALAPRRFLLWLFSLFAVVALALAAVGVYGVISYSVSRRTHEIGIRMALGAAARDVVWLVIRQGLTCALIGVTLGLALSYSLTHLMQSMLFNVQPTDPATFAVIALLLIGIALLAAYLPARRATKVDPLVALRHE